jgi:uncharacterized protein YjbI with pentapeptide repeats
MTALKTVSKKALAVPAALLLLAVSAAAQDVNSPIYAPSVWDLPLGAHASELPTSQFINFACGTDGGPPSLPLTNWLGFSECRPDPTTGLFEVYFEYDNELELWAKANQLTTQAATYEYTSVYAVPIIASALFDADGFMVMLRLVTNPDIPVELRELAVTLGGFLRSRFGVDGWACTDLPRIPGEQPYNDRYEKQSCQKVSDDGYDLVMETHNYRRPGQNGIDPITNMETVGQFWSATRLQMSLIGGVPNRETRLAEIAARPPPGPSELELLVARAMSCPGCDFTGANFKRADLTGANLAGANLSGANLHEAILRNTNLAGANLAGANMNGINGRQAQLNGADLTGAMMYQAVMDGANLENANLTEVLAGRISLARTNLQNATMISMDLLDARITDANMQGVDLRLTWAENAQLTRSNLTGARVSDTVLAGVSLINAILVGTDFTGADLIRANLRGANVSNANFSYARLTFATLADLTRDGTIWANAALPGGFNPN